MANIWRRLLARIHPGRQKRKRERTKNGVEKEDFLLSQIDEFREKARQLQGLLASKESKVRELQSLVSEREEKAQELEQILNERQEEADGIIVDVNRKVDELTERVTGKMTEMETAISGQVADMRRIGEEQLAEVRKTGSEQAQAGREFGRQQLEANRKFLEEQLEANKKQSDEQLSEVKGLLESTGSQMEAVKNDLSEKVHSENVKCYRNIQDLFGEFDAKLAKLEELEKKVGSVRNFVKALTWFSIINFVLLVAFILYTMGIFHF